MDLVQSSTDTRQDKVLLVGVQKNGTVKQDIVESLDELARLSKTAGAEVAERVIVKQDTPHAGFFIGKGKAAEVAQTAKRAKASLIVFDDDLSPAQGRNLESLARTRIIDRTQLILDIFAQHAQTREGRLQIELAQLEYLLPRLRRMWTHLERQKGGIGLTGPGEKQLEMDRRGIQSRIHKLKKDLNKVRRHRNELRRGRRRHGWALVSLVGYTNAGKSTLLNTLTGSSVRAYDQLFATLDPTTRQVTLPNHQPVLLTDTVGFIRKLPHHLVESFKATLEEVIEADLLMHVIDTSHSQVDQQIEAVREVLHDLGVDHKPVISVLNKMDRPLAREQWRRVSSSLGGAVPVSARKGDGLDQLRNELADRLKDRNVNLRLRLPLSDGSALATLQSVGHIFEKTYEDDSILIQASIPKRYQGNFAAYRVDGDAADSPST